MGTNIREVIKQIEAAGWVYARQDGSHAIYAHPDHRRPISVPIHPSKGIAKYTAKDILKKAGLIRK